MGASDRALSVSFEETQMAGRDTDIQRLGELTGNNVEFRQFSMPRAASSDWSLLNAVSRSAEPSNARVDAPTVEAAPAQDAKGGWSMLATLEPASPVQQVAAVAPEPQAIPVSRPQAAPERAQIPAVQPAGEAHPGFAHLFRKPSEADTSTAAAPLVELLKAISRCR